MTYEDNKKKRNTLPIVGSVRAIASDLCFLDDIQLRTLVFMDGKVLCFYKKSNNSKTMETTKEEMNNYCKKCRLRDGCLQKCKEAEIYEQGYNDAVEDFKNAKKSVKVYEA